MTLIISPEADQQYVIVKQVTALSTSTLRLVIQDHSLIVLVFQHTLTICELGYFSPLYAIPLFPVLSSTVAVSYIPDLSSIATKAETPFWYWSGCG